jgi:hypothetical protein
MPGVTKKVGRKQKKAMNKSDDVAKTFKNKLKAGLNVGEMFLATVISVKGGGRFLVNDLEGKEHTVRVAKVLFAKAAKHRNAVLNTAVRAGSNVIVDGDTIRSVIGDAEAKAIRDILKAGSKNTNSLFSFASTRSSKASKSSKSGKSSARKTMKKKSHLSLSNL